MEPYFINIISQGNAASYMNSQWVGGLSELEGGKGYWVKVNQGFSFQFIEPNDIVTNINRNKNNAAY